MTKCTLCVDRIHDEALPEAERKPACVLACPTGARLFGDVHDPDSEISRAVAERGGYALMPEWETRPANKYLPRRVKAAAGSDRESGGCGPGGCGSRRDDSIDVVGLARGTATLPTAV